MNFIYLKSSFITWMVSLDPTHWPAPSWLVSSVGRALHRYHGFKSRTGLNFFISSPQCKYMNFIYLKSSKGFCISFYSPPSLPLLTLNCTLPLHRFLNLSNKKKMHETIWHSLIVAFTIIVQKLDLTFNSIASRRAAFCESREIKHSIMCNKTKGRYQKYMYRM